MTIDYDPLIGDRYTKVMDQWPIISSAWICCNDDCPSLFRTPDNARCPFCGSEQIVDVAAMLDGQMATGMPRVEMEMMVRRLDDAMMPDNADMNENAAPISE